MNIFALISKIIGHLLFVIIFIFFSTLQAKEYKKFNKADFVADYFSGILLLNQSKYNDSYKYLKKLDGLEESHPTFSSKYLYSLVNSGNFSQAVSFSKKLDRENKGSFESDLIIGIHYLKKSKYELSSKYFSKAKKSNSRTLLDSYIADSLNNWSYIRNNDLNGALAKLNQLDDRFENLKKIQAVFLNCFFKGKDTKITFEKLISNKQTDFSRYHYFYAKFLDSSGERDKAKKIISDALIKYPRNLLLNQYKIDLESLENSFNFDCENETDVVAEIIYIAANAFSSQSIFPLSNFYLNLSKYLNNNFYAFDTLLAENFYKIGDYSNAKKIYKGLTNKGAAFKWYSNKQISRILILEEKKQASLNLMRDSYYSLSNKGIYETYDIVCAVTFRSAYAPFDRLGTDVYVKRLLGIEDFCRKVMGSIHLNQAVNTTVDTMLATDHGDTDHHKMVEYLRWVSTDPNPLPVTGSWFNSDDATSSGLVMEVRFNQATRFSSFHLTESNFV